MKRFVGMSVRLIALFLALALCGIFAGGPQLTAQDTPKDNPTRLRLWTAKLPGGEIALALSSIQMVSSHEYIVDGGARVVEVNVGINGPLVTRFYFIGPPDVQSPVGVGQTAINQVIEKAQALGERTGADQAWKRVVKNYPTTTHAHTVEYRLDSEDQLRKLFESVSKAWKQGRPDEFKAGP